MLKWNVANLLFQTPPRRFHWFAPNFAYSICGLSWQKVSKRILIFQTILKLLKDNFLYILLKTQSVAICNKIVAHSSLLAAFIVFEMSMFDFELDEGHVTSIGFGITRIVFCSSICWNGLNCLKVDGDMIATIHAVDLLSWRIYKLTIRLTTIISVLLMMSPRGVDLQQGHSASRVCPPQ